ncbi:hypothetical protein AB1484_28220 [Parafrankia sp. FMc6]|uniref:hypothetical protein n=1 Tax=Parafrankia soli TaxID=2599596 RepID=UPI0034D5199B
MRPQSEPPSSPMPGPPAVPVGAVPEVARHGSMTDAPPWIGGVTIGTLFLSAAVLITYTLLPLPGQESLGDLNYVVAGLLFAGHITFTRLYRTRLARPASGSSPHRPGHDPDGAGPPAKPSRPEPSDAPAE